MSESIKVHQNTLEELNVNAQNAVGQIHTAFVKVRALLTSEKTSCWVRQRQ